jgi:hypothetical protein
MEDDTFFGITSAVILLIFGGLGFAYWMGWLA